MSACDKCGKELTGKQTRFCSQYCSKLKLKSEWRKRNRNKLQAYARQYRKAKNGGNRSISQPARYRSNACLYCGTTTDLQVAHIKPLWAGGQHKWVITLCRKHHYQFDNLLRDWWKGSISPNQVFEAKSVTDIAKQIIDDMKVIQ